MNVLGPQADRERIELLRKADAFRDLSFKEAREVDQLLHERIYEKDEIIFEQGDIGLGIFIVVSGRVRVDPVDDFFKDAVLEFGPGEMFGELTLFEEGPRFATVTATEQSVIVALPGAEFSSLLTKNPKIGMKVAVRLSTTLCRRIRHFILRERQTPSL